MALGPVPVISSRNLLEVPRVSWEFRLHTSFKIRTHGDGVQKSSPGDSGFARVENPHLGNLRTSKTCGRAHLAFPFETLSQSVISAALRKFTSIA